MLGFSVLVNSDEVAIVMTVVGSDIIRSHDALTQQTALSIIQRASWSGRLR